MVKGKPGVEPHWAKREEFARLIDEGMSIADAVRGWGFTAAQDGGGYGVGRSGCPLVVRAGMTR